MVRLSCHNSDGSVDQGIADDGRMSSMQKMQAAMGGKPLGPNGQPSPAQIEAMRVCQFSSALTSL